jgi:hypothetical protein
MSDNFIIQRLWVAGRASHERFTLSLIVPIQPSRSLPVRDWLQAGQLSR